VANPAGFPAALNDRRDDLRQRLKTVRDVNLPVRQQTQGAVGTGRLGVLVTAVVLRVNQVQQDRAKYSQQQHGENVPELAAACDGDWLHAT
jgi:hypothetical protein